MSDNWSPVTSGLIGGAVSVLIVSWLVRWMPRSFSGKSKEILLLQYRLAISLSNTAFFVAALSSIALYQWGGYAKSDFRPFGIGTGAAFAAPTVILPLVAFLRGGKASEAFFAYSFSQGVPPIVLFPLLFLGGPCCCIH